MAENILETIAAKRRIYIEEKKKQVPLKNLISQAEALLQKEAAGEVSLKPSFTKVWQAISFRLSAR